MKNGRYADMSGVMRNRHMISSQSHKMMNGLESYFRRTA